MHLGARAPNLLLNARPKLESAFRSPNASFAAPDCIVSAGQLVKPRFSNPTAELSRRAYVLHTQQESI